MKDKGFAAACHHIKNKNDLLKQSAVKDGWLLGAAGRCQYKPACFLTYTA